MQRKLRGANGTWCEAAIRSSTAKKSWPPKSSSPATRFGRKFAWQPIEWIGARVALCIAILVVPFIASTTRAQEIDEVGAGSLIIKDDAGSRNAVRVGTDVKMTISGIIARVEVQQQFSNSGPTWVEGLYAFPLPENAAVDQLRMQIGNRVIEGEIQEKVAAQKLYAKARDSGYRASVVHQQRPNLFRTSVANIGPGESITIAISYLQIVAQEAGRYSIRFPLTITPRYTPGVGVDPAIHSEIPTVALTTAVRTDDTSTLGDLHPRLVHPAANAQRVTFDIDLEAGARLDEVVSRYHAIDAEVRGEHAHARLRDKAVAPDRDFELSWIPLVGAEPATAVFRERTDSGEHLLLMFMPPHEKSATRIAREVIFIIDTSGSMAGQSIVQARAALLKGLDDLASGDKFSIVEFNSVPTALFTHPVPVNAQTITQARSFVQQLQARGGTEMYSALSTALSMQTDKSLLRQIVFITDGAVGNEDQLMQLIRERLEQARLFTIGIGSAPNGHFMREAALIGKGTFTYIGNTDEVDARMTSLLEKLVQPVLTNLSLEWESGVRPELAPAQMADLYAGEPVVVTIRSATALGGVLNVRANSDRPWLRQISISRAPSRNGVATLWARNRIGELMSSQARGNSEDEIRSRVLPLALQYGLVSNYTSLVAVDRTPARPVQESLDSLPLSNTKPAGLDWPAEGMPKTATPAALQLAFGVALLMLSLLWLSFHRRFR